MYTWRDYEAAKQYWILENPGYGVEEYQLFISELLEFMGL
jgi:hypothetical protein